MTEKISALDVESNPDELTVRVYAGADNTFALYEDDNTSMAYEKNDCAKTPMTLEWVHENLQLHRLRQSEPCSGKQNILRRIRWK